jgi:glycosyltransferase involved in cell wall biosynthesis
LKLPFRFVKLFFVGLKRVKHRRLEARSRQRGSVTAQSTAPATRVVKPTATGTRDTVLRGTRQTSPASPGTDSETASLGDLGAIAALAEPYSSTPPKLRRRNDVCVAAVTDEFSWRAWQYEAELYTFTPKTWREALEARKPDLLLIESAWSGLNDSWYFQIRDLGQRGEVIKYYAIPDVVAWCRQRGVPTVFYNKEDPPNFDVFIEAAKQFDYVFTSDANCIPDYRKHVGHDRVFALPFAAQPRIHNPIMTGSRTGSVCFAGTWYNHRHLARHEDAHKILRPALDFDLHIFDRMAHSGNPNYRWPDEYLTAVRGALPYSQMLAAYKRYKVFLNINSVKNSPTMFARRVFELLACGTPVISSYSEGIEQLLGPDVVLMSDDEKTTRELLERVLSDDEYRERLALSGQRKVFGEHTYMHRLSCLLRSIGLKGEFDARPGITCICPVEDADDIVAARKLYQRQHCARKALVLCANDDAVAEAAGKAVGDMPNGRVVSLEDAAWGQVIKQAVDTAPEGRVALMNPRDFYGPFYLTDYAHASDYVDQEPIGKAQYYTSDGGAAPTKSGKPLAYRYVSDVYPWTLCLSRADARARAAALVGARSPWEWCNRAVRATERFYSPDCFSYVRCEEVTPTGRTPVAVSRAAASRSEALTAISA